jgi:outer membrane protein TolC
VLSLYELRDAQKSHIKALKSLERVVSESVKLGKKAPIDLLKVQRDLYDAIAILDDIKSNISKGIASMEALSGADKIGSLKSIKIRPKKVRYSISKLLHKANGLNKIKIAQYNIKKASKMIEKSKASYYPQVALDSYYGYSYGENDPTNPKAGEWADEKNYQVAINAKWDLYDFGKRDASLEVAKISKLQAKYENKQALLDLKKSIIEARADINNAYAQYIASTKQYKLAKHSQKIEYARYKSGASSINDLLYAKAQSMLSRAKLIQSKYNYQKAKYYMDYILESGVKR